jgi:radical SAM superfamily enzyme YgiQ (UPF0313 family)
MKSKIKVGFVQLNNSFSGQHYLPLSVGMLQAYVQKHAKNPELYEYINPIYQFMKIEEAANLLKECDIVGFSIYVWNEMNSLEIAKEYKKLNPNGLVVFGGPQLPNSHKQFRRVRTDGLNVVELQRERMGFTPAYHQKYPFIDIGCHGEGERVFTEIMEQYALDRCQNKSSIHSISYIDKDNKFFFNTMLPRMNDEELAKTPSPLTSGVFDKLMEEHYEHKWILMYETDRGCPYQCSYCDWGGATEDKVSKFPMKQIYDDIMWVGEKKIPYVFLCNANFGILKRDTEIANYFVEAKDKYKFLEGVSTQNAKNPKPHTLEALSVLERAQLNKATVMSQQSLNTETLKAVRRDNMNLEEYNEIQKKLASEGVYTMTDLILPMPGETYESIADAISTLISQGQHNKIQFNNLSILRNTEMGDPEYQREYGMKIVKSKIINGHGTKNDVISGIDEWQELVVATKTMPSNMWRKTRSFCWMVNLIYFNKLLQVVAIVVDEITELTYKEFFEMFSDTNSSDYPVICELNELFNNTAKGIEDEIQEEFIHSKEWLNVYWPPEEYALIKLCKDGKLKLFYEEAKLLINKKLSHKTEEIKILINESIDYNSLLIKMPFQTEDASCLLSHNIPEFYRSVLIGSRTELKKIKTDVLVDRTTEKWGTWEDWYEKMVWYGNRRGAYLYGNKSRSHELAGHH